MFERLAENYDTKMKICQTALELVPERSAVFIDSGSTLLCFARLLKSRVGYTVIQEDRHSERHDAHCCRRQRKGALLLDGAVRLVE